MTRAGGKDVDKRRDKGTCSVGSGNQSQRAFEVSEALLGRRIAPNRSTAPFDDWMEWRVCRSCEALHSAAHQAICGVSASRA